MSIIVILRFILSATTFEYPPQYKQSTKTGKTDDSSKNVNKSYKQILQVVESKS